MPDLVREEQDQTFENTDEIPYDSRRTSGLFLLELKEGKGLSQVAVNSVVDGCERILDESFQHVRKDIVDKLQKAELRDVIPDIEEIFQNRTKPFDALQNKYLQEKYYEQEFHMTVSNYLY